MRAKYIGTPKESSNISGLMQTGAEYEIEVTRNNYGYYVAVQVGNTTTTLIYSSEISLRNNWEF